MESDLCSKVSYNKRKKTLKQKLGEITTLCGVKASLVIYSDLEQGGGPVTWPANARQVQGVTSKLKAGIEMGMAGPKVDDLESLTEAILGKEKLKLARLQSREEDKEARLLVSNCLAGKDLSGMSVDELNALNNLIGENQNTLGYRMIHLKGEEAMAAGLSSVGRGVLDGHGREDGQAGPSGTKGK